MRTSYFTFLYNECKRLSIAPVNVEEIKQFIDSPEGQKGYKAYCSKHYSPTAQSRPKLVSTIFESFNNE